VSEKKYLALNVLTFILGLFFIIFLYGSIPFLATPGNGSAIWATGFSVSFSNNSIFDVYAKNIGVPFPASIAFGLANTWPAAILIKWGFYPPDAYAAMTAFWLAISFLFSYKIGREFGASHWLSVLGAILWLSMPIVLTSIGFAMLALGMALLSFYFWTALKLFLNINDNSLLFMRIFLYFAAAVIAVFMDGYTFVMFAAGATIIWGFLLFSFNDLRKRLLSAGLFIHIISLLTAYFMYILYERVSQYPVDPMDFFRGWALDLSFILLPSKDITWFFDSLGLSIHRNDSLYFGDASVWESTFCIPIILSGLFSWWRLRNQAKLASCFLLIAVFGFYMALGPSLKINSVKSIAMQQEDPNLSRTMPAEYGVVSTGNAWLSQYLPGFKSMRASYRWTALGVFGFWLLLMLLIATQFPKRDFLMSSLLIILIFFNIPHLKENIQISVATRQRFFEIDRDLVANLKKTLNPHDYVAFLPIGNDFIINYVASKLNIYSYNIGGDKNMEQGYNYWPDELKKLRFSDFSNQNTTSDIVSFFLNTKTDAIVIPYFHTIMATNHWPCGAEKKIESSPWQCLYKRKQELLPVVESLKKYPFLNVYDTDIFAVIRLKPEFNKEKINRLGNHVKE